MKPQLHADARRLDLRAATVRERFSIARRATIAITVALACAFRGGIAGAQQPPPISAEEYAYQVKRLELETEAEKAIVRAVYEDFVAGVEDIQQGANAFYMWQNEIFSGFGLPDEVEEVFGGDSQRVRRMRDDEIARLEREYFATLRDAFPARTSWIDWAERAHRRWRSLNRGFEGDVTESPDLIALVEGALEETDPYDSPELAAVLDRYDREVDAILVRAMENYRRRLEGRKALIVEGDYEGLADLFEQFWLPETEHWLVARRFVPLLRNHLSPEQAEKFQESSIRILYGTIFQPARIDVLLEDALKREDLSQSQRDRLRNLEQALEGKRAAARREMIALADEYATVAMARKRAEFFAANAFDRSLPVRPPEDIAYGEALDAYRAIGSDLELEIARILEEVEVP